ncbi:hypothetical protein [Loktanella sp. S4079]|uniref:hypothetical protein n=1 Tax=Loktanella sp. S4079 TaxID=579483 RepID=UPI000696D226|nr:hypothetical protein [Loktanella sp. S4079]
MKALIMRNDPFAAAATARVFVEKGFQILCVDRHDVAAALVRMDVVDLLVMDEAFDGRLTHALALSAERANPYVSTILVTERIGARADELYDLIPSLHALVGASADAGLLGRLGVASVTNRDVAMARIAKNAIEDANDDDDGSDNTPAIPSYADVAALTPALSEQPIIFADRAPEQDVRMPVFESFARRDGLRDVAPIGIISEGQLHPIQ